MFGITLRRNFAFSLFFAVDIAEFWRRWHISLSSWFRDYVFIPLGGNRCGKRRQIWNIVATFTISGLWHGANWTFVIWGFLNGLYCVPRVIVGEPLAPLATSRVAIVRWATVLVRVGLTFFLTLLAWVFFRAETAGKAFAYIDAILSPSLLSNPTGPLRDIGMLSQSFFAVVSIAALLALEWIQRHKRFALELDEKAMPLRWATYALVFGLILTLRYTGQSLDFIYFQF